MRIKTQSLSVTEGDTLAEARKGIAEVATVVTVTDVVAGESLDANVATFANNLRALLGTSKIPNTDYNMTRLQLVKMVRRLSGVSLQEAMDWVKEAKATNWLLTDLKKPGA